MSILSRILRLFPRHQVSGYQTLYSALVTRLTRSGVYVGKTAGYPRVEVHSIREGERLDKEGALRQMNFTVESISNKSLAQASQMNDANLRLLTETELELTGWTSLGIIPVQLQDITETSDTNKILYRILQEMTVYLEQTKTDTAPETTPPAPQQEQENN